ncbi:MAG: DUF1616 domain-containing protein [Candidatus Thermoplasmatota archaeon]
MKSSGVVRTKLIVITIVVLLAISVAGVYCLEDRPVDIEVEERETELAIAYLEESEDSEFLSITEAAETNVEDYGNLTFQVELKSFFRNSFGQSLEVELNVDADFEEKLDLETFKFTAVEAEENEDVLNHIDFMTSRSEIDNGEQWPSSENLEGITSSDPDNPAFVGYDLYSNDFEVRNEINWTIPDENIGEEFTLELQAVVDGQISEEVVSTVLIHIERADTVFEILGEEGENDDYPTELDAGEFGTFSAVVKNHEHEQVNYTLKVGVGEEYEDWEYEGGLYPDYNFTFPSNNTYYQTNLSLAHEDEWNQTMNFSIEEPGDYKLSLFLLRDGEVYRTLHLWVEVN